MNPASTLVTRRPDRSLTAADRIARGLGWFSIGLGIAELVAPGRIARALGLEGKESLLRAYGGREIGAGMWALSDTPAPAIWSRVGGDLVDLGTLAAGFRSGDDDQRRYAGYAIAAVAGITVIDVITAAMLTTETSEKRGETRDYSDRSGFPGGVDKARGAAGDFKTPKDFRAAPSEAPRVSGGRQLERAD
ncbi:MAG TPA: hypothetical protein VGW34_15500 [Allosphingosinicella sp.]|nr:hypothetical protein [Allosphingosinicella sp.]